MTIICEVCVEKERAANQALAIKYGPRIVPVLALLVLAGCIDMNDHTMTSDDYNDVRPMIDSGSRLP